MSTIFINRILNKTENRTVGDLFTDMLDSIDSELRDLKDDVKSGIYSNSEIAERIEEIRGKIY